MAATPFVEAPQGRVLAAIHVPAAGIDAAQARGLTAINFPSKSLSGAQARVLVAAHADKEVDAPQARVLVAGNGRIATPEIRVFTFTIDGHDFYAIRLGDITTLVYDTYSQQWIEYTSQGLPFWRANAGINWVGAQKLAYTYGTDVVVGDDVWGVLYFLDPDQAFDQHPDYLNGEQQLDFQRIVMGQVLASGRQAQPVYVIFLDTDNYGFDAVDFTPQITLDYSDDQGRTYVTADTYTSDPNNADVDYRWYSLGQITSPGRLFRITDNGIVARIDAMQMNDDG